MAIDLAPYILDEGEYERLIISDISASSPRKKYGRRSYSMTWIHAISQAHEDYNFPCSIFDCSNYSKKSIMVTCEITDLNTEDDTFSVHDDDRITTYDEIITAIPVCISCEAKTREQEVVYIHESPCIIDYEASR